MRNLFCFAAVAAILVASVARADLAPTTAELQVNVHTIGDQENPAVCQDSAGNFVVLWESYYDDNTDVFGRRFSSTGAPRGSEFLVNTHTEGPQDDPRVCCDAQGNFTVTFEDENDGDADSAAVFVRRYASSGDPLDGPLLVNSYTSGTQEDPDISCDSAGNFTVVWSDLDGEDGDEYGVFAQRFDSSGGRVGTEFQVNTYTQYNQGEEPAICCDQQGNFIVAWGSNLQDGDGNGIFAQRFDSSGQRLATEFQVNSYTIGNQGEESNEDDDVGVAISCEPNGDFIVAWTSAAQDGTLDDGVFAQRFGADGSRLGAEFQVNAFTDQDQDHAQVCCESGGKCTVVYESGTFDGSDNAVVTRQFSRGVPIGTELQVNATTEGDQGDPALACKIPDNIVMAWTSEDQDGSDEGVFARLFAPAAAGAAPVPVLGRAALGALLLALGGLGVFKARRRTNRRR